MNLAARLYACEVRRDAAMTELEAILTAICPGWCSWQLIKPDGVEVFGSFESARGAAALHAQGFTLVILHDHRAGERAVTCRCRAWEI
jgi:hypothetical protein